MVLIFCVIAFALFLAAFRYSFIHVSKPLHDCEGQSFPVALSQLSTSLYVIETYGLGLSLLTPNKDHSFVCIGQAVVVAWALGSTIIFQVFLQQDSANLKFLAVLLVEDEASAPHGLLLNLLRGFKMLEPKDVPLTANQDEGVKYSYVGFDYEAIRVSTLLIWLPRDLLGVSDDEVAEAGSCCQGPLMNNEYARLNEPGNLRWMETLPSSETIALNRRSNEKTVSVHRDGPQSK